MAFEALDKKLVDVYECAVTSGDTYDLLKLLSNDIGCSESVHHIINKIGEDIFLYASNLSENEVFVANTLQIVLDLIQEIGLNLQQCFYISKPVLLLAVDENCSISNIKRAVHVLNIILQNSSIVHSIVEDETLEGSLQILGRRVSCIGDFECQALIFEAMYRLTCEANRAVWSNIWFQDAATRSSFISLDPQQFELNCRKILNYINRSESDLRVFSFIANSVIFGSLQLKKPCGSDFWIDMNYGSQSISFYCAELNFTDLDDSSACWETIVISLNNVASYAVKEKATGKIKELLISLNCPCQDLLTSENVVCPEIESNEIRITYWSFLDIEPHLEHIYAKHTSQMKFRANNSDLIKISPYSDLVLIDEWEVEKYPMKSQETVRPGKDSQISEILEIGSVQAVPNDCLENVNKRKVSSASQPIEVGNQEVPYDCLQNGNKRKISSTYQPIEIDNQTFPNDRLETGNNRKVSNTSQTIEINNQALPNDCLEIGRKQKAPSMSQPSECDNEAFPNDCLEIGRKRKASSISQLLEVDNEALPNNFVKSGRNRKVSSASQSIEVHIKGFSTDCQETGRKQKASSMSQPLEVDNEVFPIDYQEIGRKRKSSSMSQPLEVDNVAFSSYSVKSGRNRKVSSASQPIEVDNKSFPPDCQEIGRKQKASSMSQPLEVDNEGFPNDCQETGRKRKTSSMSWPLEVDDSAFSNYSIKSGRNQKVSSASQPIEVDNKDESGCTGNKENEIMEPELQHSSSSTYKRKLCSTSINLHETAVHTQFYGNQSNECNSTAKKVKKSFSDEETISSRAPSLNETSCLTYPLEKIHDKETAKKIVTEEEFNQIIIESQTNEKSLMIDNGLILNHETSPKKNEENLLQNRNKKANNYENEDSSPCLLKNESNELKNVLFDPSNQTNLAEKLSSNMERIEKISNDSVAKSSTFINNTSCAPYVELTSSYDKSPTKKRSVGLKRKKKLQNFIAKKCADKLEDFEIFSMTNKQISNRLSSKNGRKSVRLYNLENAPLYDVPPEETAKRKSEKDRVSQNEILNDIANESSPKDFHIENARIECDSLNNVISHTYSKDVKSQSDVFRKSQSLVKPSIGEDDHTTAKDMENPRITEISSYSCHQVSQISNMISEEPTKKTAEGEKFTTEMKDLKSNESKIQLAEDHKISSLRKRKFFEEKIVQSQVKKPRKAAVMAMERNKKIFTSKVSCMDDEESTNIEKNKSAVPISTSAMKKKSPEKYRILHTDTETGSSEISWFGRKKISLFESPKKSYSAWRKAKVKQKEMFSNQIKSNKKPANTGSGRKKNTIVTNVKCSNSGSKSKSIASSDLDNFELTIEKSNKRTVPSDFKTMNSALSHSNSSIKMGTDKSDFEHGISSRISKDTIEYSKNIYSVNEDKLQQSDQGRLEMTDTTMEVQNFTRKEREKFQKFNEPCGIVDEINQSSVKMINSFHLGSSSHNVNHDFNMKELKSVKMQDNPIANKVISGGSVNNINQCSKDSKIASRKNITVDSDLCLSLQSNNLAPYNLNSIQTGETKGKQFILERFLMSVSENCDASSLGKESVKRIIPNSIKRKLTYSDEEHVNFKRKNNSYPVLDIDENSIKRKSEQALSLHSSTEDEIMVLKSHDAMLTKQKVDNQRDIKNSDNFNLQFTFSKSTLPTLPICELSKTGSQEEYISKQHGKSTDRIPKKSTRTCTTKSEDKLGFKTNNFSTEETSSKHKTVLAILYQDANVMAKKLLATVQKCFIDYSSKLEVLRQKIITTANTVMATKVQNFEENTLKSFYKSCRGSRIEVQESLKKMHFVGQIYFEAEHKCLRKLRRKHIHAGSKYTSSMQKAQKTAIADLERKMFFKMKNLFGRFLDSIHSL